MGFMDKVKNLTKREKKEKEAEKKKSKSESQITAQQQADKEKKVAKKKKTKDEKAEELWEDFKGLCSEFGVGHREVISKAAWHYIEMTGGIAEDPIQRLQSTASTVEQLDKVVSSLEGGGSYDKIKTTTDAVKNVAELKKALKEFKSDDLSLQELMKMAKEFGFMKGK